METKFQAFNLDRRRWLTFVYMLRSFVPPSSLAGMNIRYLLNVCLIGPQMRSGRG